MNQIISAYTWLEAVEDGVLREVTNMAKEIFKTRVAVTQKLWETIEPTDVLKRYGQDEQGRLWDVLYMCNLEANNNKAMNEFLFSVIFLNEDMIHDEITLKASIGPIVVPGSPPALTISFPDED